MLATPFQLVSFPVAVAAHRLPQRLPPPIRSCRRLASDSSKGGKGMNWLHEMELQVRDYELDAIGILNNAVYSNYCECGMHQLVEEEMGYNSEDEKIVLALSETSYKYIAPLRKREKFLLKVRIYDYSAARLYVEQFIYKLPNHEPILECKTTIVSIDEKSFHAVRIPPSLISIIDQFSLKEHDKS